MAKTKKMTQKERRKVVKKESKRLVKFYRGFTKLVLEKMNSF